MRQRQVLGGDDGERPWWLAAASEDIEDDVVTGGAGGQGLGHGVFDQCDAVAEHRCQHTDEPAVGIIAGPQLTAQARQRRRQLAQLSS